MGKDEARTKMKSMQSEITIIKNPMKTGACYECRNHYKGAYGHDICAENHIGILTRMCAKISECSLFCRMYRAGAPERSVLE